MIFVTVGMHPQGFERLVRAADDLAASWEEPVMIQRGCTTYEPRFAAFVDYVDEAQMEAWLREADVVVSHAGAGSILQTLYAGKPLVIVPRLRRYGEHIDDHQLELAGTLARQGKAVALLDFSADKLLEAIVQASALVEQRLYDGALVAAVGKWLAEQSAQRARG